MERFISQVHQLTRKHNLPFNQAVLNCLTARNGKIILFPLSCLSNALPGYSTLFFSEYDSDIEPLFKNILHCYSTVTQGEFMPGNLELDFIEYDGALSVRFHFKNSAHEILIEDIEEDPTACSRALNQFAETHLSGRWIEFSDRDGETCLLYLPANAYPDFRALKKTMGEKELVLFSDDEDETF